MKLYSRRFFAVFLAFAIMLPSLAVSAGSGSADRERAGDTRQRHQEMLEDLLDLSTERLARTRSVIERLEAMDEKQREILRKRVRDFHRQTPEEIKRQRDEWRAMSPEERWEHRRRNREEWEELWGLNTEEGDVDAVLERRFQEYFQNLPGEERLRIIRKLREPTSGEEPSED
jgi:hypothetical protein